MLNPGPLESLWYGDHPTAAVLAPLAWLYRTVVALRRSAYRVGLRRVRRLPVPVVVVGNLAVGGTGKTPLTIFTAHLLAAHGWRPGIVCRGYRGAATTWPQQVRPDSDPVAVGDEAVLLARRARCPVAAGPDRVEASLALVRHAGCDLVVSDDGLQHLALGRDVEIAVVDGERGHGNGRCLPAGPLREPLSRLSRVDIVVRNGGAGDGIAMRLVPGDAVNLADTGRTRPLASFRGAPVHAACGIGHPERFFRGLESHGLSVVRHAFPDHHPFVAADLRFEDGAPVLVTEKDAVKCERFATPRLWCVPVTAEVDDDFARRLDACLSATGRVPAG